MVLACHGISKAFGEEVIVADASFHIEDRKSCISRYQWCRKINTSQDDHRRVTFRRWTGDPYKREDDRLSRAASTDAGRLNYI